jgi:hypothetical protein
MCIAETNGNYLILTNFDNFNNYYNFDILKMSTIQRISKNFIGL